MLSVRSIDHSPKLILDNDLHLPVKAGTRFALRTLGSFLDNKLLSSTHLSISEPHVMLEEFALRYYAYVWFGLLGYFQ